MAEIEALRNGLAPPPPDASWVALMPTLMGAVARDPDVYRAFMASRVCLTRLQETCADDGFVERIRELAGDPGPSPTYGPDRAQLLTLLEGAPAAV